VPNEEPIMAKTKSTSSKPKFNFKELMLKKGEYIGLGAAVAAFAILLLLGISTWSDKADPTKISTDLNNKSASVSKKIADPNDTAVPPPLPKWAEKDKKMDYIPVAVDEFPQTGPLFDPTGRPDSKRKNPLVLGIEEFQPDLVRGSMRGYDIIDPPEGPRVAVQVTRKIENQDKEKLKKAMEKIKKRGGSLVRIHRNHEQNGYGGGSMSPSSPPGPMSPASPASRGPKSPGSGSGGPRGMSMGRGMSGFDTAAERTETTIMYIPLEDLDKDGGDSVQPAQTVVPLRLFVANCTIPLKRQLEEVKKAMRLDSIEAARPYAHYDGFEVQRQISQLLPDGKYEVIMKWQNYNYEDAYIERIDARKLSDYVEGTDDRGLGRFLPYFYRYEEMLVMPLPELIPELGSYPKITLKAIVADAAKLEAASTPKVEPSKLLERLQKKGPRKGIFEVKTGDATGASQIYGKSQFNGPGLGKSPNTPASGPAAGPNGAIDNQEVDVDHLLLRFVDCDIQPGLSYEYRIRLRMVNPNYNYPQYVSNPADAKEQILFSPWVSLGPPATMPRESFLYSYDYTRYYTETAENFKKQSNALRMLQVKPNQAVVQQVKWLESIRMDGKQEPIGGWVVGATPVGRGNYIGKKTYVKIPLWSSAQNEYVFRDHTGDSAKGKELPKECWPVDFSTQNVLVDFDGGKVAERTESGRSLPTEDVATEMLILGEDGQLQVRRSSADAGNGTRGKVEAEWRKWLKAVKDRPTTSPTGPGNQFERPMSK